MDYAVAPMSLSHTFGNVTAFVTEYVKGWFPLNYFKTVNIASTIAYRHFNVFDNTNREFIKKNKPMLIIRPRLDLMNDDVFLNRSLLTTRITDNFIDRDYGNLQPFIEDTTKGIHVRYLMNRIKMYFDVTIIVESQMEQINQAVYIKNRVRQDLPFVVQAALESNVPKEIMQGIATDAGIDINDTKAFLDYVNSVSFYPVTYKMKNSTGNDEFFRYYPAHIDSMVTGLSMDDGSKKGFVDDSYAINFTVETEFTTSGLYYFFTKEPKTIQNINMNMDTINIGDGNNASINPVFTVTTLFDIPAPPGWNLYTAPLYKVDSSATPDQLDISSLFNRSLKQTIEYHVSKGIPMDNLIKVHVFKDNVALDAKLGDFEVDLEKMILTTNKVNKTSTYRLIIHVHTLYVNNLIGEMLEIDKER